MEWITGIAIAANSITAIIYAVLAYKKAKEPPKDEVWETTMQLLCSSDSSYKDSDDFTHLYVELKAFKDNGCSLHGATTVRQMLKKRAEAEAQPEQQDSPLRS